MTDVTRVQAALPLLDRVTRQALEDDYVDAARRRAREAAARPPADDGEGDDSADPSAGERRPSLRRATVIAVLFGLLVATAAAQTYRQADTVESGRSTLITRVTEGRERVTELQSRIAELRTETEELNAQLEELSAAEGSTSAEVATLGASAGYTAVSGPGVRIVVSDSDSGDPDAVVKTADLRHLVTGLWEAGAEAISVNGLRLTTRSAIVTSGGAINVNTRSLTGPYTVEAIGDTRTLQVDLDRTIYGQAFFTVVSIWDLGIEVNNIDTLDLPAASLPALRFAEPLDNTGDVNPSSVRPTRALEESL